MLRTAFYRSPSIEIAPDPYNAEKSFEKLPRVFFFRERLSPPLLLSHDNSTRWQLHHTVLRSHAVISPGNSSAGADSFFVGRWGRGSAAGAVGH